MVTPPAVSAKIPSVRASRRIPSRTSSSVTDAHDPPDLPMTSTAHQPSAGTPTARELGRGAGQQADSLEDLVVGPRRTRSPRLADDIECVPTIGRIADGQ